MSLSPINSLSSSFADSFQNVQQRRSAFQQLGQALQSGDLGAAQTAFSLLTQNAPSSTSQSNPLAQDVSAIGQALQSGDLKGAQTAFAKLQQDAQSQGPQRAHHGGHHHHHVEQPPQTDLTTDGSVDVTG
jgi:hypothetical protein